MGIWDTEDSALDLKRECEIGLSQVTMLRAARHFGLSSSSPFCLPSSEAKNINYELVLPPWVMQKSQLRKHFTDQLLVC